MNITAGAEAAIKHNNSNMIIQTDLFAKVTSRTNLVLKKSNTLYSILTNGKHPSAQCEWEDPNGVFTLADCDRY